MYYFDNGGVFKLEYTIKEIVDSRTIPLELLHLADPSDEMLDSYLDRSVGFVCLQDRKVIGALLMMQTRPYTTPWRS